MILYVNERNEVKDVNTTTDPSLTALEVLDEGNPFSGWSVARICCYKVSVKDGHIVMFTPYVDSRLLEHIDQLGKQVEIAEINAQSKIDYLSMMTDVDMEMDFGEDAVEDEVGETESVGESVGETENMTTETEPEENAEVEDAQ